MTTTLKIYLCAAGLIALAIGGQAVWSNYKIGKLESSVARARADAERHRDSATLREAEAAAYIHKIDYLETQLTDIQTIAKKQDEQLEIFTNNSSRARGNAAGAKRVRTIAATADELCQKLAELGHGC